MKKQQEKARRSVTREFKLEAVRQVIEEGRPPECSSSGDTVAGERDTRMSTKDSQLAAGLIAFLIGSIPRGPARAVTRHVPSEYQTIQIAIMVASTGDTTLVDPGTCTGPGNRDLHFDGKEIVLLSEAGPEGTIVDYEGSWEDPHRGFFFSAGETPAARVEGFTVRGGSTEHPSGFPGGDGGRSSASPAHRCRGPASSRSGTGPHQSNG